MHMQTPADPGLSFTPFCRCCAHRYDVVCPDSFVPEFWMLRYPANEEGKVRPVRSPDHPVTFGSDPPP